MTSRPSRRDRGARRVPPRETDDAEQEVDHGGQAQGAREVAPRRSTVRWQSRPENWTVVRLIEELKKRGVTASATYKKAVLIQLYKDNDRAGPSTTECDDVTNYESQPRSDDNMAASGNNTGSEIRALREELAELKNIVGALAQSKNSETATATPIPSAATVSTANSWENTGNPTLASRGVPRSSCPPVVTVSEAIRESIVKGKYVNFAQLLNPAFEQQGSRIIDLGNNIVIKPAVDEARLNRALSFDEFSEAFMCYREIMCKAYPERRAELDSYQKLVTRMYRDYGGTGFYTYHVRFSKECATLLSEENVKVDWSIRDMEIFTSVFAGYKILSCAVCGSCEHKTASCLVDKQSRRYTNQQANSPSKQVDIVGRPTFLHQGREICNNFNEVKGCRRPNCDRGHVCLHCYGSHPRCRCNKLRESSSHARTQVGENNKF